MVSQQGDVALLDHPVAQELLRPPLPACVRSDGAPDVAPIGFHWNGSQLVLGLWLIALALGIARFVASSAPGGRKRPP